MALEHPSGLPLAFVSANEQAQQGLVFHGHRTFVQARELNDLQVILRNRQNRVTRLIAQDGDRFEGADAVVDRDAGTVVLTAGKIVVAGDVFPVAAKTLSDVPMTGRVEIGVRLVRTFVTSDDDPTLRGLVPGSLAEGEDGAAREVATIGWALGDADDPGDFHQVYLLQDGTILDQKPPPSLNGINAAIRLYDRPHGHYIVSGNHVTALGANGGAQHFSIEEGEANIDGVKNVRHAALRIAEPEEWDVGAVPGETHTFTGSSANTITVARFPIDTITSILLTKEKTVTVTRGTLANGQDGLPDSSVIQIVEVKQGATTFSASTDYIRTGDRIDWAPSGAEPLAGSSYSVKYRYRAPVTADSSTDTTITVSGGAEGGDIIVAYTFKLPRVDIIGLTTNGAPVYVKGVSAHQNPVMPVPPANVLPLCEVRNNWMGTPIIVVDTERTGVRLRTWADISRFMNQQEDLSRLLQLERMRSEVDRRDPAAKKNMFVDPFTSDYYRDAGTPQTGAVGNGILQLAIEPEFFDTTLTTAVTLDWVEEMIVEQSLKTGCVKINPYQNFVALPGQLVLTPAVDFWTERSTEWTSPVTLEFQRGINWGGPLTTVTTSNQLVGGGREEALPFLRQRDVAFTLSGFFEGEVLTALTFDGVNVLPGGLAAADEDGVISGTFTIPANVPAGTKSVNAVGAADGTVAQTFFTGQGTLAIDVMRRVTTINRWTAPPVQEDSGSSDPQAQNFMLANDRQLVGVNFHLCHVGDTNNHILVHQVSVENGTPTVNIEAEAFVSMTGATVGTKQARYSLPVTTPAGRDRAFVIKTDDGEHSISIAALGGFDEGLQKVVTVHPYPIGPRSSSVNSRAWTVHQGEAVTFDLIAAYYPVTTKTVELGSFSVVDKSDFQVRAAVELPNSACSVIFELERSNGTVYRLLPFQVLQLNEWITETVELRAILTGTNTLSPILYAPVEFIAGEIATEATYVSRAFDFSTADRVSAYLKQALPSGSTCSFEYRLDGGAWADLPVHATEISTDPEWVELNYRKGTLAGDQMQLKITLAGGAGSRPRVADLGAGVM